MKNVELINGMEKIIKSLNGIQYKNGVVSNGDGEIDGSDLLLLQNDLLLLIGRVNNSMIGEYRTQIIIKISEERDNGSK